MVWEAIFWSLVSIFLAIITVVAFGSEPPAKPIGWLFLFLTLGSVAYLIVRWRQFRKGKETEEAPTVPEPE
jgi:uncharacterized membrane protein YfcA